MGLMGRLACVMSAALVALFCGSAWIASRWELRRAEAVRDEAMLRALAGLADRCGRAWGPEFDRTCGSGLELLGTMLEPAAFQDAAFVDAYGVARLAAGGSLRSGVAAGPWMEGAMDQAGPWIGAAGDGTRVYSVPVAPEWGTVGNIAARYREAGLRRGLSRIERDGRRRVLEAALLAVGFAVLAAAGLTRMILSPLRRLWAGLRAVAEGDLRVRLEPGGGDEFGELDREFNRMAESLSGLDAQRAAFISKIAHDLKNPLGASLGWVELVARGYKGPLSGTQVATLESALKDGRRLSGLIENLQEVTRIEEGRLQVSPEAVDVEPALETAREAIARQAAEWEVEIAVTIQPGVGQVSADPLALRRVLNNLLSNACAAAPSGGTVSVSVYRGKPGEVVFSVSDSGPGIPAGRQAAVFEKFAQIPENRGKMRPTGGIGLGLFISRRLAEAMGGSLWLRSEPGQGATFYFNLPGGEPPRPGGE